MTNETNTATAPSLTGALAAVQAQLPQVNKSKTAKVRMKTGGEYSYKYADLADVTYLALPLLGANGLAWVSVPTFDAEGNFVLQYALKHTSGDEITGTYPLPDPTKHSPQDLGSALTYARRYALCCVVGIAPDEDVDAQDAPTAAPRAPKKTQPSKPLGERLQAKADKNGEIQYTDSQKAVSDELADLEVKDKAKHKAVGEWWKNQGFPRTHSLTDKQCEEVLEYINFIVASVDLPADPAE